MYFYVNSRIKPIVTDFPDLKPSVSEFGKYTLLCVNSCLHYTVLLLVMFFYMIFVEGNNKWKNKELLVQFFNKLAHEKCFHPTLQYSRWYDLAHTDIAQQQVCGTVCVLLCSIIVSFCCYVVC